MWDTLFQKVRDTQNHILHHTPNIYWTAESADLRKCLKYYPHNGNRLRSHCDCALADHSDKDIEYMGQLTSPHWVKQLDKLHIQFLKESKNREAGQLSLPKILGVASSVWTVKPMRKLSAPGHDRHLLCFCLFPAECHGGTNPMLERVELREALKHDDETKQCTFMWCLHKVDASTRGRWVGYPKVYQEYIW
jgi:hypothetical protein